MVTSMARHRMLENTLGSSPALVTLLIATLLLLWSICQSWTAALSQQISAGLTPELALLAWLPGYGSSYALTALLLAWGGWVCLRLINTQRTARYWYTRSISDPLTGIANRRGLRRHVRGFSRDRRQRGWGIVLIIDLDNFKEMNDRYGHNVGDQALRAVATLLKGYFKRRDDWLVARLGGDEFIVTMPTLGPRQTNRLRHRVLKELIDKLDRMSLVVNGEAIIYGASVGYAEGCLSDLSSVLALARQADQSMFHAKRHRHFYTANYKA
jgi:diguanylate cyclase (GGDEF)-like protein